MADIETALHTKYRPKNLDEVVGHTKAVQTLKGIVSSGKWPSAIAFFGPTSAGKTTLAHALVSSTYGAPAKGHPDFTEVNASEAKTIDDVRAMIQVSSLRPSRGKRRFILIDEAQGLLSNPQAAAALLKPLESPPKTTTWIIGSMDPAKFETTANGKAIVNRCTQFILKKPSAEDLDLQAKRIILGEEISFISKAARALMVEACNQEMRTLAQIIQAAQAYHEGLGKDAPDKLSAEDISEVLMTSESDDVVAGVQFLTCVYAQKFASAQKYLLEIQDGFGTINKLLNMNWFVLNDAILKGQKHRSVWGSPAAFKLKENLDNIETTKDLPAAGRIHRLGLVQTELAKLKGLAQTFSVSEPMALSQFAFTTIQLLKAI